MKRCLSLIALAVLLAGCGAAQPAAPAASAPTSAPAGTAVPEASAAQAAGETQTLRLATTTSTADSGLLDAILPDFEKQYNARVEVVAVGTGQALKLGQNGDADVLLVHARKQEDAFVEGGFGINRRDVMYNDFVVVGPKDDPAKIAGMEKAGDAFKAIADNKAIFDARGDASGTSAKELGIWAGVGISPTAKVDWYKSLGQGMGETLITANEQGAYTLSDRGTYLSMHDKVPNLVILVGGATIDENKDKALLNPYGVISVNAEKHQNINADLAEKFAAWITSQETQAKIGEYGKDRFGQPLFYPGKAP
ncbi:MAG TPA: substrate-binding domain-containing protein [Roseiflexaceae bacterium]|nr:substrate-binding domain-containing protein [Roseiflexaceae bacterium]